MAIDPRVNRPERFIVGKEYNKADGREIAISLCLTGVGYWEIEVWATGKFGTDREYGSRWSIKSDKPDAEKIARREANRRWVRLRACHGPNANPEASWEERKAAILAAEEAWEAANPQ